MSNRLKNPNTLFDIPVHYETPRPICRQHAYQDGWNSRHLNQNICRQKEQKRNDRYDVTDPCVELHSPVLVCGAKSKEQSGKCDNKYDLATSEKTR